MNQISYFLLLWPAAGYIWLENPSDIMENFGFVSLNAWNSTLDCL